MPAPGVAVAHLDESGAKDLLTGYSPKHLDSGLTNATIVGQSVICTLERKRQGRLADIRTLLLGG